mmetsp:Transcript_53194/g.64108  ORF Transcript_53194/g.64108 Transcript_53194/m.64108 type:complete len:80 (-) Transcript_53194:203-442(-)
MGLTAVLNSEPAPQGWGELVSAIKDEDKPKEDDVMKDRRVLNFDVDGGRQLWSLFSDCNLLTFGGRMLLLHHWYCCLTR